ncbi:4'-phosphopantetheinyl transferase family protein [Burkholderia glumae]|uniref:4'-phosphopantetheinyl transferase family protein n=1 Tax=Burkholderia glumae TaxID=337 RepID=UPI002036BD8E|nr:4'-phosphopantetheinyl transferase superfamily protein [Burkholderia glumae]MCM2538821.1 4'-phosphopantetheinyl transferase superfamily protein [Burkholderia glumae]
MASVFETASSVPFAAALAPHRLVPLAVPEAAARAGVQLLRVDFAFGTPLDAPAHAALDAAERARAARFLRAEDAIRHAATRAALRHLLGFVLQRPAASLRFAAGEAGRPELASDGAAAAVGAARPDFNVSHSGDHALIAWSATTRVGVDIEASRTSLDWASLGPSVFAPADEAAVHGHAPQARRDAFFRVWTAKEALLKVLGVGITGGLTAFSVLDPHAPGTLAPVVVDPLAPASGVAAYTAAWVDAAPGYAACLAWRPVGG